MQLEVPAMSEAMSEAMQRFEEIDTAFPDLKAELIDGSIYIDAVVTHLHGQMVMTIGAQLMSKWCVTTEVDTFYEGWHGSTLVRPDITVSDPSCRGRQFKLFPADEVILVVEVVSESNPENDTDKKVVKYAQAGIPYYLIVNPIKGTCLLHSTPSGSGYRDSLEREFGEPVPIGAPLSTEIDTSALYTY